MTRTKSVHLIFGMLSDFTFQLLHFVCFSFPYRMRSNSNSVTEEWESVCCNVFLSLFQTPFFEVYTKYKQYLIIIS